MPSKLFIALCIALPAVALHAHEAAGTRGIRERCVASSHRTMELQATTRAARDRALHAAPADVPAHLHEALRRLLKVARLPAGVRPELAGVHSTRSAFALASGTIVVASRLWSGSSALEGDEAAAVIAHELAHLELGHMKERLCDAVAGSGDEAVPLAAATGALHRAIWSGDDQLAVRMMQGHHQRELQADRRAAELLRLAGFAPDAVTRMLVKLARVDGGAPSGTHPALETRLENLGVRIAGHP